jgi:hypothetical protein
MSYPYRWISMLLVATFGCGGRSTMRLSASDGSAGAGNDPAGMLPCSALNPLADLPVLGPWQARFPTLRRTALPSNSELTRCSPQMVAGIAGLALIARQSLVVPHATAALVTDSA